jgi:hypothetical protein
LDKDTALKILTHEEEFKHSTNMYDWLGSGVYFWENNLERARQFAEENSKRDPRKIKSPYAIGAILDLKNCLDLLDQKCLDFLKASFEHMQTSLVAEGKDMPRNSSFGSKDFDFKNRELDCATIRYAIQLAIDADQPFDSVRAAFHEGGALYETSGFSIKSHIQIAIINPDCIKGIFIPRNSKTN